MDKVKVGILKEYYQVLNLALPLVLILIIGLTVFIVRKRKFTRF